MSDLKVMQWMSEDLSSKGQKNTFEFGGWIDLPPLNIINEEYFQSHLQIIYPGDHKNPSHLVYAAPWHLY